MTTSPALERALHHLGEAAVGDAGLHPGGHRPLGLERPDRAPVGGLGARARPPPLARTGPPPARPPAARPRAPRPVAAAPVAVDHQPGRRPEAQRRVGHAQHVVLLRVDEGDVGGHAGAELQLGVVDVDDGVVGDHVLDRLRRVADLPHLAAEDLRRVGVDREAGVHPGRQPAHVGLGHAGVDLHLGQVLGDDEEGRRRQRGGHRLAHVDVARDDHAVGRREDVGVGEVDLGRVERGPRLRHLPLGGLHPGHQGVGVGDGGVGVGLGDELLLGQRAAPVGLPLGVDAPAPWPWPGCPAPPPGWRAAAPRWPGRAAGRSWR